MIYPYPLLRCHGDLFPVPVPPCLQTVVGGQTCAHDRPCPSPRFNGHGRQASNAEMHSVNA